MADIQAKADMQVSFKINLELTISEAQALDAICGYGPDRFIEWFYANLGKHYLRPHEDAMRSLFKAVRSSLPSQISKVATARKDVQEIYNKFKI